MPSKSRQEHKIKPLVQVKLAGKKYRFVRCKSPYMEHILYFRYLGWKFDYYFSRYKLGPSLHVSSPIFQYFQTPLSFILLYSMPMQVPSSLLNQKTLLATLIVLPLFEKANELTILIDLVSYASYTPLSPPCDFTMTVQICYSTGSWISLWKSQSTNCIATLKVHSYGYNWEIPI